MVRAHQFTLSSLLVATAFIAAACALIRFIATAREPEGKILAAFWLPILLCGAIGKLRGRVQAWLGYGVMIDCALMTAGPALVWLFFVIMHLVYQP